MTGRSGSEWRLIRAAHPGVARALDRAVGDRPARRVPGLGVLVQDPTLVRRVLADGDCFAKSGPGSSGALWTPVLGDRVILNMDGPDHLALRRQVADLFAPRAVRTIEDSAVRPLVERAHAELRAGRVLDVVGLARGVAASAIAQVVGLTPDAATRAALLRASDEIEGLVRWHTRSLRPPAVRRARAALAGVQDAAGRAWDAREEASVMGRLAVAGSSREQARALAAALFLTGTGTVAAGLPRIVGQLLDGGWLVPDRAATLDVDRVVVEGLRMTTPSLVTLRSVVAPTTLDTVDVRPGDRVVALLWWATRGVGGFDPLRTEPSDGLRQLWFGAGAHFCLGAPLALAELRAMVGAVLDVAREVPLHVTGREAARRVLVPRYARLDLRAGAA